MPSNSRFVFDTNVVISALLLTGSVPRQAFDKALNRGKILLSLPVLAELNEVFSRKRFDKYLLEEERVRFLAALVREAEMVEITIVLTVYSFMRAAEKPGEAQFIHASGYM